MTIKSSKLQSAVVLMVALGLSACSESDTQSSAEKQKTSEVQPQTSQELAAAFPEPLVEEEMGISHRLDTPYKDTWVVIHDANFNSMIDGRFIVMDSGSISHAFKGIMHGGMVGALAVSQTRGEIYIATTYHSRGISGERTDIIAIHDTASLEKTAEILVPAKRGANMPFKASFRLSNDESLSFNYNFTPASSISVTDMDARKFLTEIPIPGCTLAYPMGAKGFASLCGDGTMMGVSLDASGTVIAETHSAEFNDIDKDSLFLKNARFGDRLYFPTFTGNMQPIDLSTDTPKALDKWSLLTDAERAENWRPGGWQLIAGDAEGVFYILMHPNGAEGTQKNGGPEVWIYNAAEKKRIGKIELKTWGLSLAVASDRLIVTNAEMQLDIYDLTTKTYAHTYGDGLFTPFIVYTGQGQ